MNRNISVESRGLAVAALAAGVACALVAFVAIVTAAIVVEHADAFENPVLLGIPWQQMVEPFVHEPWLVLRSHVADFVMTLSALCVLFASARHPVVTLPIHRVDELENES